jgi:2-C-methyl-D-erythritol 4-phosphate cytidylyltransferase/2-C-methyl-D-erythritol 2,4-cyclodiphosphate synthase
VILVHDAARPMVEPALIAAVAIATARHGAAIPVVPVAETLKRIDGERVGATVDRTALGTAQTPQGVRRDLLREAWRRYPPDGLSTFTDEAALLEACSIPVHVVPGDPGNLKVTLPSDLQRAATVLAGTRRMRTGIGHDSHPFGPGMPLHLAASRSQAHRRWPATPTATSSSTPWPTPCSGRPRWATSDRSSRPTIGRRAAWASTLLVDEVRRRVESAGWRPASVDLTVIAARPRLGAHLGPMRDAIAALLGLDRDAVSVKASSGNLDGSEGAGRAISALVIATVEPVR